MINSHKYEEKCKCIRCDAVRGEIKNEVARYAVQGAASEFPMKAMEVIAESHGRMECSTVNVQELPREKSEFTCPQCGGHRWGTSNATSDIPGEQKGHCHESRCTFSWVRTEESDLAVGVRKPPREVGVGTTESSSTKVYVEGQLVAEVGAFNAITGEHLGPRLVVRQFEHYKDKEPVRTCVMCEEEKKKK